MDAGTVLANPQAEIRSTTSHLTWVDHWDHFRARIGINRSEHRVEPGLYTMGNPTAESPVFVTANYTLSFDALRSALPGINGYILVLDTQGVNVWCAAGKGTFGTDELVHRIDVTGLQKVVNHRKLILPQLGAPGVAAHEVKRRSTFGVKYGPVRAADLPEYLAEGEATPAMRRVQFPLRDRLAVAWIDILPLTLLAVLVILLQLATPLTSIIAVVIAGYVLVPILWRWIGSRTFYPDDFGWVAALLIPFALTPLASPGSVLPWAGLAAATAGFLLFPMLLPWIPTHNFSTKGFILGDAAAVPVIWAHLDQASSAPSWAQVGGALAYLLFVASITAFISVNFTGYSTYTSKSGVRRELNAYLRIMGGMFVVSLGLILYLIAKGDL